MDTHTSLQVSIENAQPDDDAAIEALLELAFGPGRFTKTAYRVRERTGIDPNLSFVARGETGLLGSIAFAPVRIGETEARLLGPLAVAPAFANKCVGRALIAHGLNAVFEGGCDIVILVGDRDYYARSGFEPVPMGRVRFPGPVDPARILWTASCDSLIEGLSGDLTPFAIPGGREHA